MVFTVKVAWKLYLEIVKAVKYTNIYGRNHESRSLLVENIGKFCYFYDPQISLPWQ